MVKLTTDAKDTLFNQHLGLLSIVDEQGKPEILVRVVELWDEETFIIPEKSPQVLQKLEKNPHVYILTSNQAARNAAYKFMGKAEIHKNDHVFSVYKELRKKPPHSVYKLPAVLTVKCEEFYWKKEDGSWVMVEAEHAKSCHKCAKERRKEVVGESLCVLCGGIICKLHRFREEPICVSCARRFGLNDGWKREMLKRVQTAIQTYLGKK